MHRGGKPPHPLVRHQNANGGLLIRVGLFYSGCLNSRNRLFPEDGMPLLQQPASPLEMVFGFGASTRTKNKY
jgi:hypothetical protein